MYNIHWTNAGKKAAGMGALAARVRTTHVHDWADEVAEAGDQEVKSVIEMGGVIQTKKGGPRVKSGAMLAATAKRTEAFGDGSANAVAGWPNGGPTHLIFQERGTLSQGAPAGIAAMSAIPMAQIRMSITVPDAGAEMLAKIRGEWNAI